MTGTTNPPQWGDSTALEDIGLPFRVLNTLKRAGINTIGGLRSINKEGLLAIHHIGPTALAHINRALNREEGSLREVATAAYKQALAGSKQDPKPYTDGERKWAHRVGWDLGESHRQELEGVILELERGQLEAHPPSNHDI